MIVLDASAVVDLLLRTPIAGRRVAEAILEEAEDLHAPHLLDAEVGQTLRRFVLRNELGAPRARLGLRRLRNLPVTRHPHQPYLDRAFALRDNVSVYDGLYLALAEGLGASIVTRDGALARVPGYAQRVIVV